MNSDEEPALVSLTQSQPGTPVLLTSVSSAALLDGSGEFSLLRETRGAPIDWGGVYAQGVRLTGPWRLGLLVDGQEFRLSETLTSLVASRGLMRSRHRLGSLQVEQEVVAVDDPPGAYRSLLLETSGSRSCQVRVEGSFAPFLVPVLLEGIKPYEFRLETSGHNVKATQHGFALTMNSEPLPSHLLINRASWLGDPREGEVEELGFDLDVTIEPNRSSLLRWVIWGGLERTIVSQPDAGDRFLVREQNPGSTAEKRVRDWEARTPVLRFPQAPELESAYRRARGALRSLYYRPTEEITGLLAGFPWYAALWCRDLAWMLPAVLWLGDHGWVETSIGSVFRFQAKTAVPMLGSRAGELPMQISPGPIFLYGTSDTSLYYPTLVRNTVLHTGRIDFAREVFRSLERVVEWGQEKSDPTTLLLKNGGEVQEIAEATGGVGRVHYGIDAVDTTIWDSTDRRDHAIDVEVLWTTALDAIAELAERTGQAGVDEFRSMARRVAEEIQRSYVWTSEGYLFDSRSTDGTPVKKLRPNALRAVSAGLFPGEAGRRIVLRAAREDITTPWGVRTLAMTDSGYDPTAYHDGQVWTIATAWAADAALCAGEIDLGVRYLRTIAELLLSEFGQANECYRGDRAEPFDSCFLLGFSVAPFLTTLFERLWGISMDAAVPQVRIEPRFPKEWSEASVDRLRVGDGYVGIRWNPGTLDVRWKGSRPLTVLSGNTCVSLRPGAEQQLTIRPATETS